MKDNLPVRKRLRLKKFDYSKEEIDYAISKLNNYYIELLKLKFWKDFNISDNKRLDRHENKLFYTGVVRKVKKLIKEKN